MQAEIHLQPSEHAPLVNPRIYGHFAEHLGRGIYEGIWVGEDSPIPNVRGIRADVVEALKDLNVPVLRWPGGCFADEYHWMDGIGPRADRKAVYNSHWGGVVESNQFGTHEFLDLCEQIGAEPYISANVGSGTVREMQDWVEYITADTGSPMARLRREHGRQEAWALPFLGVGNESWGCGGSMRPEFYADLYRQYNTFVRSYSGNQIYRVACGANSTDIRWTEVLMERAGTHMNGLSLHNYTLKGGSWPPSGKAIEFDESEWIDILSHAAGMDALIGSHVAVMDRFDPERKVGLIVDEWGTWYQVEEGTNPGFLYQQNSLRDALVAAIHFHIFHRYADRIPMANIAQTVNVLQAMILTDGPSMVVTPTYWVFHLFREHQGGQVVPLSVQSPMYRLSEISMPALSASATAKDGVLHLSLINVDPSNPIRVSVDFGSRTVKPASARILTAPNMTDHNSFDQPNRVQVRRFEGCEMTGANLTVELPSKSVAMIELR